CDEVGEACGHPGGGWGSASAPSAPAAASIRGPTPLGSAGFSSRRSPSAPRACGDGRRLDPRKALRAFRTIAGDGTRRPPQGALGEGSAAEEEGTGDGTGASEM